MRTFLIISLIVLSSCAFMHRHQVHNVDSRILTPEAKRFELLFSQTGIEIAEGAKWMGAIAKASSRESFARSSSQAGDIIAVMQMGPRTGNPIYDMSFIDTITPKLQAVCPAGDEISGLTFLREMNKYPVVSGEIIKVSGYCIKRKVQ